MWQFARDNFGSISFNQKFKQLLSSTALDNVSNCYCESWHIDIPKQCHNIPQVLYNMWNGSPGFSLVSAMVPGLVLFKAWQISWKKEQKLGFFPWIKNNLITFHRIFVLILELISKIHKGEMKFSRFCYFWRVILQIMSCLIECFFSCWNWIANTSKFQTEIFAFLGTFLFKIQQIFEKRTKFVL